MRAPPLLRILRPALAPTAACDVLAAAWFVGGADAGRLALAAAGSVCLYAGGMAQNDLWDRARDAKIQPDRPLVANPALVAPARLLVLALFAVGLTFGWLAGVFWASAAVAVFASAYNMGLKRVFPADALTMGAARGANLCVGFAVAGAGFSVLYIVGYALYIAGVTATSRCEDLEPEPTRKLGLLLAYLPLAVACVVLGFAGDLRGLALALPAAVLLISLVRAMRDGTRGGAKRHVFHALLTIYALHAAVLWSTSATVGLIPVLACAATTCFLLALLE